MFAVAFSVQEFTVSQLEASEIKIIFYLLFLLSHHSCCLSLFHVLLHLISSTEGTFSWKLNDLRECGENNIVQGHRLSVLRISPCPSFDSFPTLAKGGVLFFLYHQYLFQSATLTAE